MTTVTEPRPTVALVRHQVRDLLQQSPTFRSLPEESRRELAHDIVNVGQYMADAGGLTYGVPLAAAVSQDAAQELNPSARALEDQPVGTAGDKFNRQGGAVAAKSGVSQLGEAIQRVNFPEFVAGLIRGVFQAIVDASIQQMEAFAELVKNVSKSVDEYMKDNITPNQARDYLTGRYPDQLELDIGGDEPKVIPKPDANDSEMPDFFKDLGLDEPVDSLDEQVTEEVLVPAARKQMAIDRQQMLLMMVLMGINRLVVTDGSIKAAVIFELNTKDLVSQHSEGATTFDQTTEERSKSGFFSGWFSPSWKRDTTTKFNVTTTSQDDSEASAELKAKLTGDVNVRFKSETFPLANMTTLLGLQEPSLPTTQARPSGQAAPAASRS
jgi:hypothetical protein